MSDKATEKTAAEKCVGGWVLEKRDRMAHFIVAEVRMNMAIELLRDAARLYMIAATPDQQRGMNGCVVASLESVVATVGNIMRAASKVVAEEENLSDDL